MDGTIYDHFSSSDLDLDFTNNLSSLPYDFPAGLHNILTLTTSVAGSTVKITMVRKRFPLTAITV